MKCQEVQTLHGPYLDSELDAKSTLEIERHLEACSACAGLFAEAEKLDARLMSGLSRGSRTVALWERIEREVVVVPGSQDLTQRRREAQRGAENSLSLRSSAFLCVSALTQLRAGWQRSRWAWAGLGTVWVVILALNFTAREPDAPQMAGQELPLASEMRLALKQQQLLMAELAVSSVPASADKPKPAPPSPRSDRRSEILNA